jgi:hypothetical protein
MQYNSTVGWTPLKTKKHRVSSSIEHVAHGHAALEVQRTQPVADRVRVSKVLLHHTAERLCLERILLRSLSGWSVFADAPARDDCEK